MSKITSYIELLKTLENWDDYLLAESGLPGPRANLELAYAVAESGNKERFLRYISLSPEEAPTNSPAVFLVICGTIGLGRLVAEGQRDFLITLREFSSDPRWRVREAVAMALQRFGRVDMAALLDELKDWSRGNWWEKRAAAAAIAEPDLLKVTAEIIQAFDLLDGITESLVGAVDRDPDSFRGLRQSLGYCWSVLVAALPDVGKQRMERWLDCSDRDVRWIMLENLKKKRLERMDEDWVKQWRTTLEKKEIARPRILLPPQEENNVG